MNSKEWDCHASDYHKEIVSPFFMENNKLIKGIKCIKNKSKKSIAEFGCGCFFLGKYLKDFKNVHASDFSQEMVKHAKKLNPNFKIKKEDIRKINYKNKFDIVVSINSILMPSHKDIQKSMNNLFNALKKKGNLILILPSMEAVLYHGLLLLNDELPKKEKKLARKKAKSRFEIDKYDFFLGHYNDGEENQKFYYKHEIEFYLEKAGFKNISVEKFHYPWDMHDYDSFPKEKEIWDWMVKAEK